MVPELDTVDKVPDKVYVPKSKVPPAVVVSVPFTTIFPLTVSVPEVLLNFKSLYVPATMDCKPEDHAYSTNPFQVLPLGMGAVVVFSDVFITLVALVVMVDNVVFP